MDARSLPLAVLIHLGVRVPLKFDSCPSALIVPLIELPSIVPFPVTGSS
jgi:hypothetical protein